MKVTIKIAIVILAFSFIATSYCQSRSFAITIAAPQDIVKMGAAVQVDITFKNISDQDLPVFIPFDETGIAMAFDIDVRDNTGAPAHETAIGLHVHQKTRKPVIISGPTKVIPPGGEIERSTNLAKVFDLSKHGTYSIQVTKVDPNHKSIVKSNTITIAITP